MINLKSLILSSFIIFFIASINLCQVINRDTTVFINNSDTTFTILMNGNLDAENTFSWDTIPNIYLIGFQSMISITITNSGDKIINRPRLIINNRGRWFDLNSINNEAIDSASTFNEKVKSVWSFVRDNSIHRNPPSPFLSWGDPVKLMGIYGYMQCGNSSALIVSMPVNERNYFYLQTNYGHAAPELKIGTEIALIDADIESFYLKLDNKTFSSQQDVSSDRHLIRRSTHYGKQYRFSEITNKLIASVYRTEPVYTPYATVDVPYPPYNGHTLDYNLRPAESLCYEWYDGAYFHTDYAAFDSTAAHNALPSEIGNGKFIYRTNFKNAVLPVLLNGYANVDINSPGSNIHADSLGQKAEFVIKVTSPFTIVNGTVTGIYYKLNEIDSIEIFFSKDSVNWTRTSIVSGTGSLNDSIALYNYIKPVLGGGPTFFYFLKFVLSPSTANTDCGIDSLEINTTFQVNRFFMPHLKLGNNQIEYSDQNNDSTNAIVSIKWQESTANTPPGIVPNAVFPADGASVDSSQFTFIWQNATDPDGDDIIDYEFQLSDSPGMVFTLSPVFNAYTNTKPYFAHSYWQSLLDTSLKKNISAGNPFTIMPTKDVLHNILLQAKQNQVTQTAFPGFSVPVAGLLNAGESYYWRVRAKDSQGTWGTWGPVWSFTQNGAMLPVNCAYQITENAITLSWDKNPAGATPSYYEIHRSNEWLGFTPDSSTFWDTSSSENYSFSLPDNPVPDIFYRIIAVGADGQKSGVSEVISLPYPYLFRKADTVLPDSTFVLDLTAVSLWFPYYNNTLYEGIATDTIYPTLLYLPGWLVYDTSNNRLTGLPDSSIVSQMVYDTLLSLVRIKLQTSASFPHLFPAYQNQIPSKQNILTIRLNSSYINNAPFNLYSDTSFIVATNYYEQVVNGYDADTIYSDSVYMQVLAKPQWLNNIYLTSSSVKLSGTPGTSDTGDFIAVIQTCDRLGSCVTDTLYIPVKFPYLNVFSDTVYLCSNDTFVLFSAVEKGYLMQWFKDTVPINGATDDSLMVTGAGIYKVRLSAGSMMAFSSPVNVIAETTQPVVQMNGDTLMVFTSGVSYQWFLNGAIITGADQNKYIVDTIGNYFVRVVLNNGCTVYSDTINVLITSQVIHSYPENKGYTTYYNAGNNTLNITINNSITGPIAINLVSVMGDYVTDMFYFKTENFSKKITLNNVAQGLYILRIQSDEGVFHSKIIIFHR